jgi:hypothetical protein
MGQSILREAQWVNQLAEAVIGRGEQEDNKTLGSKFMNNLNNNLF